MFASFLYAFSKSIERTALTKDVEVSKLREGDILESDLKLKGKIVESSWEGLTLEDLKVIRKFKKKVRIKEGIVYAPAFLIALFVYVFLDNILAWII